MDNGNLVEISDDLEENFELVKKMKKSVNGYLEKISMLLPDLNEQEKFSIVFGSDSTVQHSNDGNIIVYRVSMKLIANFKNEKKLLLAVESDQFTAVDLAHLNAMFKFYKGVATTYKQLKHGNVKLENEF